MKGTLKLPHLNLTEHPLGFLRKCITLVAMAALIGFFPLHLDASYASHVSRVKSTVPVDLRFPGKIEKDAKREKAVVVTVETQLKDYAYLDATAPENWQSTGLYAAPGETITLSLKDNLEGLIVQIGSHGDQLEEIKPNERLRAPVITVEKDLHRGDTKVANPYGGLIYIKPTLLKAGKPTTQLIIKNAIKAPTYILGVTSQKDWQEFSNHPKVPMAELITKKVILTVPSKYLKYVKDPKKLMETWDQFIDQVNGLAGLGPNQSLPNRSPQEPWRYVADVQISWGYMYAGYPIMLYDDACIKDMLSIEGFKNNGWGFYHELGHNYQQSKWTPDALGEVTCNIFSLYMEEFYGTRSYLFNDNADTGQDSFKDALQFVNSDRADKNFMDESQVHVFTRLVMFWQLKETYGWDLYPKLFKSMRTLPADRVIDTDQDKMDVMVEQLCKITGDDLLPFFNHWGINPSPGVKERLKLITLKPLNQQIWLLTK